MGSSTPLPSALADLTDVALSGEIADGDALTFDSASGEWHDRPGDQLATPPAYFRREGSFHYPGLVVGLQGTGTGATVSANRLMAVPWFTPRRVTIDHLCWRLSAGAPGPPMRFGLYQTSSPGRDPYPGGLVRDFGEFAAATTTIEGAAVAPLTIQAGLYWLVTHPSLAISLMGSGVGSSANAVPFWGGEVAAGGIPTLIGDQVSSLTIDRGVGNYGPLPDPYPPAASPLDNASTPLIGLRLTYP